MTMRRNERGFTLVELLVAFSIMLVGMTGIIAMFSAGLSLERRSTLMVEANLSLEELLPHVRRELALQAKEGGGGALAIARTQVPGRNDLEYAAEAEPMPGSLDGSEYLMKLTVWATGAADDDGFSYGHLPFRIVATYEQLVRQSPQQLSKRQN